MGLRDIGASLPPGFRFYPSDEELVCHYLYKKIGNEEALRGTLVEIDLHTCEPWQLPEVAKLNGNEWYFFSFRDRKYSTGFRTNRATTAGYWKATGKDRMVMDPTKKEIVGMRKTLVFYRNRAPNGIKTGWIMHEFRIETPHMPPKEDWVLCRVFHKTKSDQDTTETTTTKHTTSHFTFDAMMAESSSYYLLPNNVEFLPSYNSNGLLPLDINLEETSFNGSSYGVGDSNSEEMKYEIIDNNIHNNAFPFNYFVA
ncbi:NAC domain-containing protein 21/22-like [Cucumis melo]|uniref:NAC domain-containing protein 21/22-like n=1 Tax=Cucumis melo TaxID=3656 RepID=A0A1S3C7P3_CUCME|nr:NAC domain-containing protein 21/22-like [Cucumis melo]